MSRRAQAPVRSILPDPKFSNEMLAKFMNVIMKSGKKSAAAERSESSSSSDGKSSDSKSSDSKPSESGKSETKKAAEG